MKNTPEVLRVKRRHDEDSLQALLLEEQPSNKKGKYVFKLAHTLDSHAGSDTPLLKLSEEENNKIFVLEQPKPDTNAQLPVEITEMLDSYLKLEESAPSSATTKKPSKRHSKQLQRVDLPSMEYVYDVYIREIVPEDEFVLDKSTVGYIRIVDEQADMIPEADNLADPHQLSDDEDSNGEDYYRNDYPEDEDDDRSILFGSESVSSDLTSTAATETSLGESTDRANTATQEFNPEYDALFQGFAGESNLLSSLNSQNYIDLDLDSDAEHFEEGEYYDPEASADINQGATDSNDNDEQQFERYIFFPDDEDNPLAIHRDKIFGKLQRMSHENN